MYIYTHIYNANIYWQSPAKFNELYLNEDVMFDMFFFMTNGKMRGAKEGALISLKTSQKSI